MKASSHRAWPIAVQVKPSVSNMITDACPIMQSFAHLMPHRLHIGRTGRSTGQPNLSCTAAWDASAYQQLSAFLFNDVCLPSDMSQVLLHHVLVLAMHSQAEGVDVLAGCAVFRDDSSSALANVMSPEHSYAHVGVRQCFIVCQRKDWLCRILRLADQYPAASTQAQSGLCLHRDYFMSFTQTLPAS